MSGGEREIQRDQEMTMGRSGTQIPMGTWPPMLYGHCFHHTHTFQACVFDSELG